MHTYYSKSSGIVQHCIRFFVLLECIFFVHSVFFVERAKRGYSKEKKKSESCSLFCLRMELEVVVMYSLSKVIDCYCCCCFFWWWRWWWWLVVVGIVILLSLSFPLRRLLRNSLRFFFGCPFRCDFFGCVIWLMVEAMGNYLRCAVLEWKWRSQKREKREEKKYPKKGILDLDLVYFFLLHRLLSPFSCWVYLCEWMCLSSFSRWWWGWSWWDIVTAWILVCISVLVYFCIFSPYMA